jgi:hypothetical protein
MPVDPPENFDPLAQMHERIAAVSNSAAQLAEDVPVRIPRPPGTGLRIADSRNDPGEPTQPTCVIEGGKVDHQWADLTEGDAA